MLSLRLGLVVLAGGGMVAEIRVPDAVLEAYHAAEPPGLSRELGWCMKRDMPVFIVKNATGYEDESVFFDADGRILGRLRVPDTGPPTGDFDPSEMAECKVLRKRQV